MGQCIGQNGQILPDVVVKQLILGENIKMAYWTLCNFITKRKLEEIHLKLINHISDNKITLDLAPRGFGKSTVGDVDYCILRIIRNPDIRIMIGSKTQTQSEAFVGEVKAHLETNMDLIRIFGNMKSRNWNNSEFTVSTRTIIKKEATMTALGASGAVVSKHFDIIMGDDLVGFENARTDGQRQKLKEWFYSSLRPTLEPDGEMHILGTRYHPMDLYQDFMESGNYSIQIQKAIKGRGGKEKSLWEEKFSLEVLKTIRNESGSIIFNMQYQNDIELAKGTIFKAKYFRYYDEYRTNSKTGKIEILKDKTWIPVTVYMGSDLAISASEKADYFVLMVVGIDADSNVYVLDYVRERLSFDKQFNTILQYGQSKFPMVERIGIEAVAYQQSLPQELRRSSTLPIVDIDTVKDKVSRAHKRSALFENGKVYFRSGMDELESELLLFPDAEHDDLFDGIDFAIITSEQKNVRILDRNLFRI